MERLQASSSCTITKGRTNAGRIFLTDLNLLFLTVGDLSIELSFEGERMEKSMGGSVIWNCCDGDGVLLSWHSRSLEADDISESDITCWPACECPLGKCHTGDW